jgi:hypothetical protein
MAVELPFESVIEQLQREGKLPNQLTRGQVAAMERSLQRYADAIGIRLTQMQLDTVKQAIVKAVQSLTNPVEINGVLTGFNPATARSAIAAVLKELSIPELMQSDEIAFALETASKVVMGATRYVSDGAQNVVDEYPAYELLRIYRREVPRGWRRGPKGRLIAEPDQDWPSRWAAAGGTLYEGKMIALKNSPVWQNLGDGAGGYSDTLGNPFPPFAFNSGFDVNNVGRAKVERLGLLDADEPAVAPKIDLGKLFYAP